MGIAQLIFRKGNFIGEIELDVIVDESTNSSTTITSNPVENGADVNDHIIINPMTFSMSGIVSDTKVGILGGLGALEQITSGNAFTKDDTPSKEAWEELLELQANRTPFTLVTNLKEYDNVVIESLSTSQNKDTSNSLHFTANMKEIIFVGSDILTADQFSDETTSDKAIPDTDGGLKQ
jgi:Dit-like phage tail protein